MSAFGGKADIEFANWMVLAGRRFSSQVDCGLGQVSSLYGPSNR